MNSEERSTKSRVVRRASAGSVSAATTAPTPWAVTSQVAPTFPECRTSIAIAGTRAMNGDRVRATAAMPRIGYRHPFTRHAWRAPTMRSPQGRTGAAIAGRGAERTKEK